MFSSNFFISLFLYSPLFTYSCFLLGHNSPFLLLFLFHFSYFVLFSSLIYFCIQFFYILLFVCIFFYPFISTLSRMFKLSLVLPLSRLQLRFFLLSFSILIFFFLPLCKFLSYHYFSSILFSLPLALNLFFLPHYFFRYKTKIVKNIMRNKKKLTLTSLPLSLAFVYYLYLFVFPLLFSPLF